MCLYKEMNLQHYASETYRSGEFTNSHYFSSGQILIGGLQVTAIASFGWKAKDKTPIRSFPERITMPLEILYYSDSFEFRLALHAYKNIYNMADYVATIDVGDISMAGFRIRFADFFIKTTIEEVESDFAMLKLCYNHDEGLIL